MASTSAPFPAISAIDAARDALAHTRRHLFPIRPQRWLVLGLLAFLDQCGRTGGGGGGDSGWRTHGSEWPSAGWRADIAGAVLKLSDWLSAHAALVALGAIAGLIVLAGVMAIVLWINARGTFMYLDNVASGRADVARPWREHATPAASYFGWRLGITLAVVFVMLFAAGLVLAAAMAFVRGRFEGASGALAVAGLVPVVLLLVLAVPLLVLALLALRDFVAPLQLTTGLPCGQAARVLEGLVMAHPGAFLLYLLLKLGVVVASGVVIVLGGCLTCCVGFLPVVMQTVFQPLFFFERAFSLFLLRQMGHDLPGRLGA
jgi:hypothetical protein